MDKGFQIQDWDTNFFGFKVVKVLDDFLAVETELKLKSFYEDVVELIYYTAENPNFKNFNNSFYDINLVSTRVPIIKKITNVTKIHPKISLYNELPPDKNLIALACLGGKQSRFGMDQRISEKVFNDIFKNWITNSIKKVIADEVLVYKEDDVIVGFATIKAEGDKGYAPIIAVDRSFHGKGVSVALSRAIEIRLMEYGCDCVIGATQEINKKALASFEKFGYELQTSEYVYHLWKKN